MNGRKSPSDILVFLLFVVVCTGISYTLLLHHANVGDANGGGGGRIFTVALMWSPAAAAFLTLWVRKLDFASIGWAWGENKWNVLAYLLPLGYAAIAYSLIWILGLGTLGDPKAIASLSRALGWDHSGRLTVLAGYFVTTAILGLAEAIPTALGEEIGWRGFLVPRLMARTNFTVTALVVGVLWTLWHVPFIVFGNYNQGTSPWVAIPCFAVAVMSASVIGTWLRLRSRSIWPSTIFHGSHNLFIQGIFTPFTSATGAATAYFTGEFGLFVPALLLVLAIYFWTRRGEVTSAQSLDEAGVRSQA